MVVSGSTSTVAPEMVAGSALRPRSSGRSQPARRRGAMRRKAIRRAQQRSPDGCASFRASVRGRVRARRLRRAFWRLELQNPNGTVGVYECLIGDPANVGLGNFVDFVQLAKEFPPVAITLLILSQLLRKSLVVAQAAKQVRPGARLEHLQLIVGHVGGLQLVDLLMDRIAHLFRGMA